MRTHRILHCFEILQNSEEADESTVEPAAKEQVHAPISGRIQTGGKEPICGGAHLHVIIIVAEHREFRRTGAATTLEKQVRVPGINWRFLEVLLGQDWHLRWCQWRSLELGKCAYAGDV